MLPLQSETCVFKLQSVAVAMLAPATARASSMAPGARPSPDQSAHLELVGQCLYTIAAAALGVPRPGYKYIRM